MKANNSIVASKKPTFSAAISSKQMKDLINSTLSDPQTIRKFTSTLISVVAGSEELSKCTPDSVVAAALSGVALGLNLQTKEFYLVPYAGKATFQMSYKGWSRLASNSGLYTRFDVLDVREGEYLGEDPDTLEPIIKRDTNKPGRDNLPVAGFIGIYKLQNGYTKKLYWSYEKILNHADRYSKSFSKEKYNNILAGKEKRPEQGSPWYDDPLSEAHFKMCKKTIIIQLLSDGFAPLSTEMEKALAYEKFGEEEEVISADDSRIIDSSFIVSQDQTEDNSVSTEDSGENA